jgi:hypothetical protein
MPSIPELLWAVANKHSPLRETRQRAVQRVLESRGIPNNRPAETTPGDPIAIFAALRGPTDREILPSAVWLVIASTLQGHPMMQSDVAILSAIRDRYGFQNASVELPFLAYSGRRAPVDLWNAAIALDLSPFASTSEVDSCHREKAKVCHPDKYPLASEAEKRERTHEMSKLNGFRDKMQEFCSDAGIRWHIVVGTPGIIEEWGKQPTCSCPLCGESQRVVATSSSAYDARCSRCHALLIHDKGVIGRITSLRSTTGKARRVFEPYRNSTSSSRACPPYNDYSDVPTIVRESLRSVVDHLERLPIPEPIKLSRPVARGDVTTGSLDIAPPPEASQPRRRIRMAMRAVGAVLPAVVAFGWWWGMGAAVMAAVLWRRAYEMATEEHEELMSLMREGPRRLRHAADKARSIAQSYKKKATAAAASTENMVKLLRDQKQSLIVELRDAPRVVSLAESAKSESDLRRQWRELLLSRYPIEESGVTESEAEFFRENGFCSALDLPVMHILPKQVPNDVRRVLFRWRESVYRTVDDTLFDRNAAIRAGVAHAIGRLRDRVDALERQCRMYSESRLNAQESAQAILDQGQAYYEHALAIQTRLADVEEQIDQYSGVLDMAVFPNWRKCWR